MSEQGGDLAAFLFYAAWLFRYPTYCLDRVMPRSRPPLLSLHFICTPVWCLGKAVTYSRTHFAVQGLFKCENLVSKVLSDHAPISVYAAGILYWCEPEINSSQWPARRLFLAVTFLLHTRLMIEKDSALAANAAFTARWFSFRTLLCGLSNDKTANFFGSARLFGYLKLV